jgi:hypothetical protein
MVYLHTLITKTNPAASRFFKGMGNKPSQRQQPGAERLPFHKAFIIKTLHA